MFAALQDIVRHRELLSLLVARNLKIRYKNSVLGFFWSLLVPLMMIVIYSIFMRVLSVRIEQQLPVLVTGIIAWQFLAMSLGDSLSAIVGNANLVTKSAFPRIMLPLGMVLANLVNFLLSGIVLAGYLLFVHADFSQAYYLPIVLVVHLTLVLGIALLFCTANVFFRDVEHLVSMLLLAWFFLTPVIYPHDLVLDKDFPAWIHALFFANPMTGIVTGYRMALLGWEGPGLSYLLLSVVTSVAVLLLGLSVFLSCQRKFGDEL